MNLQEALVFLLYTCEKEDISIDLRYNTGRYIPGELINFDDITAEPDPSTIRQGAKGWEVEVRAQSYVNDDGSEMLYPELKDAVIAGLALVKLVLADAK